MKSKSWKILIVDDEEDLSWSISNSLMRCNNDLEVQCAQDGNQAFEMLRQHSYDLVISDYRMPGKDGLELLRQIRRRYSKTKVIIMTAYGSTEIQSIVEKSKDTYYLEKPFDILDLKKMICQINGNKDFLFNNALN